MAEENKKEPAKLNEKTAKQYELVGAPAGEIYHIPCHHLGRLKVENITPEQAKELVEKKCGSIRLKDKPEKETEAPVKKP
jgi:hypothetical protein